MPLPISKTPHKQKVREEMIRRLVEGENNNMVQEKKNKPVRRARSGLEGLNKTKDNFEELLGDFSKSKIKNPEQEPSEFTKGLIAQVFKQ